MPLPLVIAHHLVWTGYGWWLPNDPRGSTSRFVCSDVIFELGNLHHGRKKVQPASRNVRRFYEEAAGKLKHKLIDFGPAEIEVLADAFRGVTATERYTCYACVLMPDHVHVLVRKHKHSAEEMIANFQAESAAALRAAGLRPPDHPVWGGPGWKVFQDCPEDAWRTKAYIEDNPLAFRMPRQAWDFVTPYDGWPLHPGHSPNSPYARRLRRT